MFSDLVMPGGMSGFDLARQVRERYPQARVILTSGYSAELIEPGRRRRARSSGAAQALPPGRACARVSRGACRAPAPSRLSAAELTVSRKNVADAAHALDQPWALGIGLDLSPQPHHQVVDAAVRRRPIVPAQQVHDLVARQHSVGVGREYLEQVELAGRELAAGARQAISAPAWQHPGPIPRTQDCRRWRWRLLSQIESRSSRCGAAPRAPGPPPRAAGTAW